MNESSKTQNSATDTKEASPTKSHFLWGRLAAGVLVALVVFGLGIGVGNGRIHIGSSSNRNNNLPSQLDYASVNQVYAALKTNYNGKLTTTQLLNGLKSGLANATNDPYTNYFTAAQAKQFDNELNNSFSGIGAELGQDSAKNLQIIAPIKGFPAAKAGLQPKDIITSINGKNTSGMSVDSAVTLIRGKAGTKVTLKVVRNKTQTLSFTITRANIQVPSVTTKILPGNIGDIQISTFANDTSDLAKKAAQQLKNKHVNGIILDLRDNPGGLLDAAVNVSSLWMPGGQTVLQERGTTGNKTYSATGDDILHGIPTVVLINGGSASASEITTGALHDNHEATVIGEKSYGKGVVQEIDNFSDGSELKVTVASWFRPNGQNINHKGITPDTTVKLSATQAKAGNDVQQAAALAYLKKQ